MRLLVFIGSLWVACSAVLPCCQQEAACASHSHEQDACPPADCQDEPQDPTPGQACSPLMLCGGCAGFTVTQAASPLPAMMTLCHRLPSHDYSTSLKPAGWLFPVWQPPQRPAFLFA